jgi:hypothetical protein
MAHRKASAALQLAAAALLNATFFLAASCAQTFDKPIKKIVLDLGRSPYLMPENRLHIHLTCSYYSEFMVKEVDDPGNKGTFYIATVPSQPDRLAKCTRKNVPGEKTLPRFGDDYFEGAKRDLLFLSVPDGVDGGAVIGAFHWKTMAKMFEDSVSLSHPQIDFVEATDQQLTMRYLRIADAPCSVVKDGTACWTKFMNKLGMRHAPMLKCSDDGGAPSVVSYPVETSIYPKQTSKALGYPDKCWAEL